MNVLILATNIPDAFKRFNELVERKNQYFILVCNSSKINTIKFFFQQIYFFIFRLAMSNKIRFIRFLFQGRIAILPYIIHSPIAIEWISKRSFDLGIHGINVIYKEKLLKCFRIGILNAHLGLLPHFRGKSVVSWSLFEGHPTGISTFIIDKGIDTGEKIVFSEEINVEHCTSAAEAKNFLASSSNTMYKKAIQLIASNKFIYIENDTAMGKRYYSMSKLLTSYVDNLLGYDSEESNK